MISSISQSLLDGLSYLTGNSIGQRLLAKGVTVCQYLQGIGSGSDVESSGEAAVLSALKSSNQSDGPLCIFDVGANTGQYLRAACRLLAGERFHVHSFEPSPGTYEKLVENTQQDPKVTLNNFGLGSKSEERDFYSDSPLSGLASLTRRRLTHLGIDMDYTERVRITTLDDYCHDREIESIDLLKLDVEGHELDVLNGSKRMFSKAAIGMVQFEFGGCNIDTRTFLQDFVYFVSEYRMQVARITPSGYMHEITAYSETYEQFRTSNFLCYRK
jgi:FkbM family methyltransferase